MSRTAAALLSLLSLLLLSPLSLLAQTTSAPTRDPNAVTAFQQALRAMGGATAISQIQDCVVQGSIQDQNPGGDQNGTFTWKTAGNQFYYQTQTSTATHVFVSNQGSPAHSQGGKTWPVPYHVARASLPFHLPAVALLAELQNQNYTLTYLGTVTIGSRSAVHIHVSDDSDAVGRLVTPQEWYFDVSTGMPLLVEFRVPSPEDAGTYSNASMGFGNYGAVSGVQVPIKLVIQEGPVQANYVITSVVFNNGLSPTTFALPTGGAQ